MIGLLRFVLEILVASPFKSKIRLAAENAALRHQLIVLRRKLRGRVQLANCDRWFLVQLYRWFPSILKVLTIIRPETLVRITFVDQPRRNSVIDGPSHSHRKLWYAKQWSVEMRKITFAVYNPPKEGLPYLAAIIAPTGAVAAVAYHTAAEAETHNLKIAMETARGVE